MCSIYESHQEFYDNPIHLSKEEQKTPEKIIEKFIGAVDLWEVREYLAKWNSCALLSEDSPFDDAAERRNSDSFAERLEELIEAVYIRFREK